MSDIVIYKTYNLDIKVQISNESIWLSAAQISEIFGVGKSAISKHIKNILLEKELDEKEVVSILETTGADGKRYQVKYYNLKMIISIGYRLRNSEQAVRFRIWATGILNEYLIKGFAMDDERLKNPNQPLNDYFDELLERIRDIRASERRFYQKVTDIYAKCSIDYDPNSETTKQFYAKVQDKFHYAMTGFTAYEIIFKRADATKPNMGLFSFKNAPLGKIRKSDISVAKNYLSADELDSYNRIVEMYLNFAEFQAKNKKTMTQKEWIKKLDDFLNLNEKEILNNNGSINRESAEQHALEEFEKFKKMQDKCDISDFDKFVKKLESRK